MGATAGGRPRALSATHDAEVAIIDQIICANAEYFVGAPWRAQSAEADEVTHVRTHARAGTEESTFSNVIRQEREIKRACLRAEGYAARAAPLRRQALRVDVQHPVPSRCAWRGAAWSSGAARVKPGPAGVECEPPGRRLYVE